MPPLVTYSRSAEHPVDAVMVLLHGLGASGHDFADMAAEFVSAPYNLKLILPHAPTRPLTIAGGEVVPSWYDILSTGQTRVLNEEHVKQSVNTVHTLLQEEDNTLPHFVAGFSQGGAVALESFLTLPVTLSGGLAMSTYVPGEVCEAKNHQNEQTPILMQHGSFDPVVPFELGQSSAQRLKAAGFDVTFESYPMQHQLCLPQIRAIRQWLTPLVSGR